MAENAQVICYNHKELLNSLREKIFTLADTKQDALISGTNIKTINSVSVLGAGNIEVAGTPGPTGPQGEQGIQGIQGPKGDKGDKGDPGENGAVGPQGEKGDKGDTGAQGPAGPAGQPGVQGLKGDKGEKGEKGDTGPQGKQGEPGKDGTSVTIKGSYDSEAALKKEHPTGIAGDAYLINGNLYV